MASMTPRQKSVVDFIASYIVEHGGVSPSYDEIAAGTGIGGKYAVHEAVQALLGAGRLRREGTGRTARSLYPVDRSEFERGRSVGREEGYRAAMRETRREVSA
jgi:SOS-response transcriptional repressor LexA